jgi:acyl-coenzyme A synthetase/AMP-(fatty) acid ligase
LAKLSILKLELPVNTAKAIKRLLKEPEHPAGEFISSGTTFAEVYGMAADLRASLAEVEQPGKTVCLAAENRAVIAAALLASLAGGPSLVLPYAFSAKALHGACQVGQCTTAITDTADTADTGKDFPAGVQCICPQPSYSKGMPLAPESSPQAELLKIFTGGSTGAPQIWSKTAENILGEAMYLAASHKVSARDRILATVPPYHIYGLLFSVVLPLVSSASVIDDTPVFPGEILQAAVDHQATILVSVPAHYRVLQDKKLALRLAFSSAGMLDRAINANFSAQSTGIVEVYGSTETGGIATRNRSLGEEHFTPFETIRWKIMDQRLAVRSPYISSDLPVDNEGFFLANDRVANMEDGQFSLKGRADTVTKVGGKRVDLEEISMLIRTHSGVSDCVVTTLPDSGGREHRISALIQGDCNLTSIKKNMAEALEPYAHPRYLKRVKWIPVQKNGKYDWSAIHTMLAPMLHTTPDDLPEK